jgi:ribosomal protein S18 acetylase RimI-like enzyme
MSLTSMVSVRPMAKSDLHRVVEIHLAAFPEFFLSFLGPRFLRLLYAGAVALDEIALVATLDFAIVGLAMGSAAPARFFSRLLRRNAPAFALAAVPALLRRPTAAARLARALLKPAHAERPAGTATLMSLAVDPMRQARGIGKALVIGFLDEAARRGARRVELTTDKLANERSNRFYAGLGFSVTRELRTPEGRLMNEYLLEIAG